MTQTFMRADIFTVLLVKKKPVNYLKPFNYNTHILY